MGILIIGGTDLISTPLTQFLLERGDDVTLFNRGGTQSCVPRGAKMLRGDRREHAIFDNQMRAVVSNASLPGCDCRSWLKVSTVRPVTFEQKIPCRRVGRTERAAFAFVARTVGASGGKQISRDPELLHNMQ